MRKTRIFPVFLFATGKTKNNADADELNLHLEMISNHFNPMRMKMRMRMWNRKNDLLPVFVGRDVTLKVYVMWTLTSKDTLMCYFPLMIYVILVNPSASPAPLILLSWKSDSVQRLRISSGHGRTSDDDAVSLEPHLRVNICYQQLIEPKKKIEKQKQN